MMILPQTSFFAECDLVVQLASGRRNINELPVPFIVTAVLPPDILAWADGLRRQHYPPDRNRLVAHVTLFHSFAPSLRDELRGVLAEMAGEFSAPSASINDTLDLGSGTALAVKSSGMDQIRALIAEHFHGALTAKDLHEPRLHITIQNKVIRRLAIALQQELAISLRARDFAFRGLALHIYRTTHWDTVGEWPFRGKSRC
jgi:hypothetical protein